MVPIDFASMPKPPPKDKPRHPEVDARYLDYLRAVSRDKSEVRAETEK
jgi:hypothetical protein